MSAALSSLCALLLYQLHQLLGFLFFGVTFYPARAGRSSTTARAMKITTAYTFQEGIAILPRVLLLQNQRMSEKNSYIYN